MSFVKQAGLRCMSVRHALFQGKNPAVPEETASRDVNGETKKDGIDFWTAFYLAMM